MKHNCVLAAGVLLVIFGVAQPIRASSITTVNLGTLSGPATNSGTLSNQGDVIEETFTLTSPSSLTAFTTSYGGGTNLNGSTASAGGFEPELSLFTAAGAFVSSEAVTSSIANVDAATGLALDAYLGDTDLAAGSYILVLTDWLNQPSPTGNNLSDGFLNLGLGTTFVDEQSNTRTGAYTLDLSAAPVNVTPEPATIWLALPSIWAALWFLRRRHTAAVKA